MDQHLHRLAVKFRRQEEFATGYSPLYASLFGALAGWLEKPVAGDQLVAWLLQAGHQRGSLDVTLLLAAGLHRDVLAGAPAVAGLADFFPTVGGFKSHQDQDFNQALRQAILNRRSSLAAFMQNANVQTNETGRGLCWLLPLMATGWPAVHLVDLGASAGLNLVAEQRAYRLVTADSERPLLDIGLARPVQFVTRCRGNIEALDSLATKQLPVISGRTGCDVAPFGLTRKADELTLMAFIWGDQVDRLQRLREGIDAFHSVSKSAAPVQLFPANLPDELSAFLWERAPEDPSLPILIYNTYMTTYLRDNGQSMMTHIDQWAAGQNRPVLWLQWEPPRDGREPPEYGWCAWTADHWESGSHRRFHLGWVHPHGTDALLSPEYSGLFSK